MRANPRTRIRPAAHTHAHIHIYTHVRTCTHVYAHAKEIFWHQICSTALSNRVPSSVRRHSLLLSNHCTIHIHIGTTLAALSVQTVVICHLSDIHYHPLAIVSQLSANYPPLISYSYQFIITTTHHLARIIFYLYLISIPTHHPINMSVCYKTLSILYILAALPICFHHSTDSFPSFISLYDSL